jgi:hypothetical protein
MEILMPHWFLKASLQHIIGCLPKSYWWNALFQKYATNGYYPSRETFVGKLKCCRQHLDHYLSFSPKPQRDFTALELGTGPWPVVPLGLYLCGASEIWSYDLVPVLNRDTLGRILELFCEQRRTGLLESILPEAKAERISALEESIKRIDYESPVQILKNLHIHFRLGDSRNSMLPAQSIDLIFSTVVLEHISLALLVDLFEEFKRVASTGAVMSHLIGLADQYASFDGSITPYNFMKYSDRQWRIFNNPVIPQSRLRLPDYRELYERTGWAIVKEENTLGSLEDLKSIQLAQIFQKYSTEDLLVLFSWLAVRPLDVGISQGSEGGAASEILACSTKEISILGEEAKSRGFRLL